MDHDEFDCFLSHNSRDKPAARALAARLRDKGVSVWLDEEQLRPVEKLRYFDAKPLPDGRHAVCGLLAEIRRREWDGNPKIGEAVHSLDAAFGCGRG